jgi:hypothetical protein
MEYNICNKVKDKRQILQIGLILLLLFVSNCTCRLRAKDGADNKNHTLDTSSPDNPEELPVKPPLNRELGGGITNIMGSSCYMNATLQIFKALYPDAFDNRPGPMAQAGQKLMAALDQEACVSREIAEKFFKALKDHLADSAWSPGEGKQEDAVELLTALFDQFNFPKAVRESELQHPTRPNVRWQNGIDESNILQIPIDRSIKKSMQHLFDASLGEETLDNNTKWYNEPNPTPGITRTPTLLGGLLKLKGNILVVQLKRFSHEVATKRSDKITTVAENPFHLVIKKEQIVKGERTEDIAYELVGFIFHHGGYGSGHYVAYAKKGEQWGLYNDERVSVPSQAELKSSAEGAYVYFYRRVNQPAGNI